MYLTRLILNPRSRRVQRELADPYELHRTVMKAFAADLPSDERVLFRVEVPRTGIPTLLVQSTHKPQWNQIENLENYLINETYLPFGEDNPAEKEVDFAQKLHEGQQLVFRLRANPTVKKARFDENGKRLNSNRVPIDCKEERKLAEEKGEDIDIHLECEKKKTAWLANKLTKDNAAKLIAVHIVNESDQYGRLFSEKDRNKRMKFHAVQFEGILQIENKAEFLKMLKAGIGPGKGLGFGLLSLAPSRG